jgi:hypothetical protein
MEINGNYVKYNINKRGKCGGMLYFPVYYV